MININRTTIGTLESRTRNAYEAVTAVGSLMGIGGVLRDLGELAHLAVRGEFPFDDSLTTVGCGAASALAMTEYRDSEGATDATPTDRRAEETTLREAGSSELTKN